MLSLRRQLVGASLRFASSASSPSVKETGVDYKSARVDKQSLSQLRKRTGYSFVNCKKALVHFPHSLEEAEAWLHQLAKEQGWEKATKVGARTAAEGLVGVATSGPLLGAMVEVNCETDFVARNPQFQALVAASTLTSLRLAASLPGLGGEAPTRVEMSGQDLLDSAIPDVGIPEIPGNERLGDFLTFCVGKLGEKLDIQRAACLAYSSPDVSIVGYTHPRPAQPTPGGILMGSFGTLVSLKRGPVGDSDFPTEALGQQLCQQIIGMTPQSVGSVRSAEEEAEAAAEKERRAKAEREKAENLEAAAPDESAEVKETEAKEDATQLNTNETQLLRQDFLLHPEVSVGEHVASHGTEVLNFVRFKCGELQEEN